MPVPIGSVEALATTVNHFYPELMATFVNLFNKKRDTPSWLMEWFLSESTNGAYFSAQTWLSAPLPVPFPRGMGLQKAGFGELKYTLYIYDYTTPQLIWHIHDRDDSRAPMDLKTRVAQSAEYLRELPDQVFFELLTETSGTRLHPDVSYLNIFGTTGLYDDSHSYGGQTFDNLLAGTGTSAANLGDDLYTLRSSVWNTVASNGEPYWDERMVDGSLQWQFVIPEEMQKPFHKLFEQTLSLEAGAISASSNYIKSLFGEKVSVNVYPRLTDANDWYARISAGAGDDAKPFIYVKRKGVTSQVWNEGNSDDTRESLMEGIRHYCRAGFGVGNPFSSFKMVN